MGNCQNKNEIQIEKSIPNQIEINCQHIEETIQSTKSTTKNSNTISNNCMTLTDHLVNEQENFFEFDYYLHARAIFEEYNSFRVNPKRKLGNLLKNNLIPYSLVEDYLREINNKLVDDDKNNIDIARNSENFALSPILWSEKIYNAIYKSNKSDMDLIYQTISAEFKHNSLCHLFKLRGNHDPESALCKLLETYTSSSFDVLMSNNIHTGAICVYNENSNDNIIIALIKYQI